MKLHVNWCENTEKYNYSADVLYSGESCDSLLILIWIHSGAAMDFWATDVLKE